MTPWAGVKNLSMATLPGAALSSLNAASTEGSYIAAAGRFAFAAAPVGARASSVTRAIPSARRLDLRVRIEAVKSRG
jgi:hypothetical protein